MRIAVVGAGSIGCYLGGRLQAAGHNVVLIGRERLVRDIAEHGLALSDHLGWSAELSSQDCRVTTGIGAVEGADLVLVTVKSADTGAVADRLDGRIGANALVVSLQNGVRNAQELANRLGAQAVAAGMVPFNVARVGPTHFRQTTQGKLAVGEQARAVAAAFQGAGLPTDVCADMAAVQWGKLVLNLNNAVNGLSGLPLKEELGLRDFRRVLAAAQDEALRLLRRAGQPVASPLAAPLRLLPFAIRSPDAVFTRIAKQMLAIDPAARSSLLDDLVAGKRTEVDFINGEVVALARRLGAEAPVNAALVRLVHEAEGAQQRRWPGHELRAATGT
ncbi:MAG: 2-dehydropantoate 2-reductase [Segniliparus sp.]|uniref:2-dehydropantoate 2-reductase n=1 Tax=Segniliparus sp. TaxID=2804064 RepID=UPI003F30C494